MAHHSLMSCRLQETGCHNEQFWFYVVSKNDGHSCVELGCVSLRKWRKHRCNDGKHVNRRAGCVIDGSELDAELVDLDQPNMGFDIEVTAKVHYKLTELASGNKIIDDTITTPHTTDMSDAFMGTERLRLANEGAMRDNIQALIGKIFSAFSKQQ